MKSRALCKYIGVVLALMCMQPLRAQLGTYKYARSMTPVDSDGYYQVHLSSDILYKAGAAGIVRIYQVKTTDTLEVPYLVAHKFDPLSETGGKPLKIINESYEKGRRSYYTFVLDTAFVYSSLLLNFTESDYDKDLSLEGSDDGKAWKIIIEKDKVFKYLGPHDDFTRNNVYFPEQNYRYLRLTLNDEHTGRVHLDHVSVPYEGRSGEVYADEPVAFNFTRSEDKRLKKTILECSFKRKYIITGIKFNIGHSNPFYKRELHVFESAINRQKQDWVLFQDDYLLSDSYNYITCRNGYESGALLNTNKLRIEIDNKDDQPLKDISLDVYTNTETIRLKLEKNGVYMLAYGKEKDQEPVYDITAFENKIPRHLKEAALGGEMLLAKDKTPQPAKEAFFKSDAWIWALMVLSILLIGGFAVSLLKQSKADKTG